MNSKQTSIRYGLVGNRLGHSWSIPIHAMLGNEDYRLYERSEQEFIDLLKRRDFRGLNVTMPYKRLALELCDELSDTAVEVGSVNTLVVREDGTLCGHNTDIGGFIALTHNTGVDIACNKVVILGSGGTSLTARAACRRSGAREIVVISRNGPVDYDALYRHHADAQVLINTTPVGMYPNNGACAVDLTRLPALQGVLDVVYNPDRTALVLNAQARGLPSAGGLYMLVAQAREAEEWFMGRTIPEDRTQQIYRRLKDDTLNIVLIGMPGCGKSCIGSTLAHRMGRPFVDCDEEIVRRAGKSIPDIFSQDGESAFRAMETQVIQDLGKEKGLVIATGGGAVLRSENVRALQQNGKMIFLERALDTLPRQGRPLSRSPEALAAMWRQREPCYRSAADITVKNDSVPEQIATRIEEAYHEAFDH